MMPPILSQIPVEYQWMIYAGAFCAVVIVLFRPRRANKNSRTGQPAMSLARERDMEQQMQRLLTELSEMSRQVGAELDSRSAKLERLLKQADSKIAALEMGTTLGAANHEAADNSPPAALDLSDARYQQVYALCDQGQTPRQIAAELHRPVGEIELILALRATH